MWVKFGREEPVIADISDSYAASGVQLCCVDHCSVHTIGFRSDLQCDGEPDIQTKGQFLYFIYNLH